MLKYTLTFEAPTLGTLIEKIKKELVIISAEEEEAIRHDFRMRTKIVPSRRKNKKWEDHEIEFLIENYRKKSLKWVGAALGRPVTGLRSKLQSLYKRYPDMTRLKAHSASPVISKKE